MTTPKAGPAPKQHAQDSDVFIDLRRQRVSSAAGGLVRDAAFETVRPGRARRRPIWINLRVFSFDGAYAFVLFLAMLFVEQLGSLSGVAMAVLPLLYLAVRRRQAREILRTRWIVFAVPAFAVLSILWSEDATITAKYGIELWLTAAAGIGLSAAFRPAAVIKGACLAFAVYVFASLAHGRYTMIGDGGAAFVGLLAGKNILADIACTGALLGMTTLLISLRQRALVWALIAVCAVAAEVYIVAIARSAGAVLALGASAVALIGLACLSALPRPARVAAIGLVLVSAGIFAAAVQNVSQFLLGLGEQLFDKDPTLTGRTYLWYRAHDLIAEKPWFGRGFYTFWRQGNTDAEGLWRYAGITGRSGFNFHNTLVELMVQIGIVGAAVFCGVALIGLLGLMRHFVRRPSLPLCFWLTYMIYCLVRAPTEAVGFAPFFFSTCLLFASVGAGFQRLPKEARRRRGYVSQAVRLRAFYEGRRQRKPPATDAVAPAH
jgi:exopolysaccharide production protein ExoQ